MDNEKSFMSSSFGDDKLSKNKEINAGMSVRATGYDQLTEKLRNLGGNN